MVAEQRRVIGVVGGLGPYAHLEFERALLRAAAARLDRPPRDQDFPEWILSAIPATPDRTAAILGEGPSPVPALLRSLGRLAGAADFAVIPCNTAHAFFPQLRARSPVPLLDMVAATLERLAVGADVGAGKVGLLATTGALRARVFHSRAARWPALELVSPLDLEDGAALQEALVMTPIYGPVRAGRRSGGGLKSGVRGEVVAAPLREAARRLVDAGAAALICGCTEIPLVLQGEGEALAGAALIDPLAVAAELAVAIAVGAAPLPA